MAHKTCNSCGEAKAETEFWQQRGRLFGECKPCGRSRNASWKRANAEKRREKIMAASNAKRQRDPMATILSGARHRAKLKGLEFTITRADVPVPERCPVLGIAMRSKLGEGSSRCERDTSPSIDRIDSTKGYVPGNVIVVSGRANRIKTNATVAELIAVADFYKRLTSDQGRQGAGGGPVSQGQRLPPAVPEVLTEPQEEARPVLPRHRGPNRDQGILPSLQLEDDFR